MNDDELTRKEVTDAQIAQIKSTMPNAADDQVLAGQIAQMEDMSATHLHTPMSSRFPQHSVQHLIEWIAWVRGRGSFSDARLDILAMLATDLRMRDFWDWLATLPASARLGRDALTVSQTIRRLTHLPGKPSNMTPAQRTIFFEKVNKHVLALIELLRETKFDCFNMHELSEDDLRRRLKDELYSWGDDEDDDGHVVAFTVAPDGIFRMPYDYPLSHLTDTLWSVYEWTSWDDQWDGNIFTSSASIVQSDAKSTPIVYFTCSLYEWFSRYRVEIPFPILATAANVALAIGPDDQVDEETVRKQVRRYQSRRAKCRANHPMAFDDDGQNPPKFDDSVLSDPF
ncbi:MAG: hypothetical protein ABIU96_02450 [Rhodanobacter sp.]